MGAGRVSILLAPPRLPGSAGPEALSGSEARVVARRRWAPNASPPSSSPRDIAKNASSGLARVHLYWTLLGLFDALVFFLLGAYFMLENTDCDQQRAGSCGLGHGDRAGGWGKLGTCPRVGASGCPPQMGQTRAASC